MPMTNVVHGIVCRWLDSGRDDGLIEREIDVVHYVQTPPPPLEEEPGNFYSSNSAMVAYL